MKKYYLSFIVLLCMLFCFQTGANAYDLSARHDIFTPAFQLLWQDFKNVISTKKINFKGLDPSVARVLNANPFTSDDINSESYYKIAAPVSYELKAKIQREIFEKFGESSKILDGIDWEPKDAEEYLLYALLKKDVEFPAEFEVLDSRTFNGSKDIYKFFGVNKDANKYSKWVKPLFYEYDWDHAVSIETKSGDRIILYRTDSPQNVYDLYHQIDKKTARALKFGDSDKLIIPFISLNERIEYPKLCNKVINDTRFVIAKAIDDIEFKLDNKGATLRNEAAMQIATCSLPVPGRGKVFDFSKPFVLYMVEEDKSLPYFALRINDTRFLEK